MDFFDEDDPAESGESDRPVRRPRRDRSAAAGPPADGGDHPSRQQIRTRQLTLAGISIVVLILLFLAFRGCLDARKERAFKNYVSDLSALTVETKQLSDQFFTALNGGGDSGDISLESEVNGNRGTAQSLLDRAQGLDAPDEIAGAQAQVELSYDLRRDALDAIANQLPAALGNKGSKKATASIAEQMEVFVASDVLFKRARFEIEQALDSAEIVVEDGVPESQFLPTGNGEPNYLDPDEIAALLSGAGGSSSTGGGDSANCDPGDDLTHGLGLVSTTAQPSGTVLTPGASAALAADAVEFEVAVQNQGDADESGIKVALGGDFTGTQTINSIAAGETQTVTIVPKPAPSSGESASLEVTVDTVCGEQVAENNASEAPYELTFE